MGKINYTRHILLENSPNARDLGGFTCNGGTTAWGKFVRTASLSSLTGPESEILKNYGVTDIIDLRSTAEQDAQPYPAVLNSSFSCHKVPMLDQMNSSGFQGNMPTSMGDLYCTLLGENGKEFATIFSIFANATGAVVFHCTAGKDRTGVTAMLLLSLLGVADADIIADYSVTEIYMQTIFANQLAEIRKQYHRDIPEYFFQSKPDSMHTALNYIQTNFGTTEKYLLQAGVSQADLNTIKTRFTFSI